MKIINPSIKLEDEIDGMNVQLEYMGLLLGKKPLIIGNKELLLLK